MIKINRNTFYYTVLKRNAFDERVTEKEVVWPGIRLCYIISGSCVWKINGKAYSVKKGDVIFFGNLQSRAISSVGSEGLEVIAMHLSREAFESPKHYSFYCGVAKQLDGVLQNAEISDLAEEICREALNCDEDRYELLTAKFTELFIKAERTFKSIEAKSFTDPKMAVVLSTIDQKAVEGISLAEISRSVNLSESTFSRRFKKCFGISFKRYIMMKKIEKAIVLLKNTDKKMIDIAFECGFNSVSGFYDTFKKITGTTPEKNNNRDLII